MHGTKTTATCSRMHAGCDLVPSCAILCHQCIQACQPNQGRLPIFTQKTAMLKANPTLVHRLFLLSFHPADPSRGHFLFATGASGARKAPEAGGGGGSESPEGAAGDHCGGRECPWGVEARALHLKLTHLLGFMGFISFIVSSV